MAYCLIDKPVNRYVYPLMNNAVMNTGIHSFFKTAFKSFKYNPSSGVAGSHDLREFYPILLGHVPEN